MSPGVIAGALVLCVAACVWALWRWWPAGEAEPAQAQPSVARTVSKVQTSPPEPVKQVAVHVVGAVRRPGVYSLMSGSRVVDAVDAAGGLLGDAVADAVNLARPLVDGEQILVPDKDDPKASPAPQMSSQSAASPGSTAGGSTPIDLNTADESLLDTLPGVGPSTASKIVADRESNGPYKSVEDLGRVPGIGPKKLEQLKGLVCAN